MFENSVQLDKQAPSSVSDLYPHTMTDNAGLSFAEKFRKECLEGSAIDPELYETAIEIIPSLRQTPGGEVEYPIDEELNRGNPDNRSPIRRGGDWGHGARFKQFNGETFQIKPQHPRKEVKTDKTGSPKLDEKGNPIEKPIKYETPKGEGSHIYLPPIPPSIVQKINDRLPDHARIPLEFLEFSQLAWIHVKEHPEIPIVITEGGKKGLSLLSQGYVGIALTGCWGWKKDEKLIPDLERFVWEGRKVIIALDKDAKPETVETVRKAINGLGWKLQGTKDKPGKGAEVYVVEWNPEEGKGIDDLTANKGADRLDEVIRNAIPLRDWAYPKEGKEGKKGQGESGQKEEKRSVPDRLIDIAREFCVFWHTPDDQGYADIRGDDGTRKTFPLQGAEFKKWLSHAFFEREEKAPYKDALSQAINTLEALACFKGETHEVFIRVAEHEGNIYIDLGTPTWEAVKVSPSGWEVVKESPVRFRRVKSQLPLPMPEKGGSLDTLRKFFSFEDQGWVMVAAWMLYSFKVGASYPIAILHGTQGSGKSTLTKALKQLVDPSKAPLIRGIADERNFAITATNTHLMAIDNLSSLSAEQSDLLCTAATGGGYRTRALHTNQDEMVFEYRKPIVMNGIDSVATRGDLLDRSMLIPVGKPKQRREEGVFWQEFNDAHPKLFGAILDALVVGLKNLPSTIVPTDTRMMDFAKFGTALEPALGLRKGEFIRLYLKTKQEAHETAIESSPVAQAILQYMDKFPGGFGGTATQLLDALERLGEFTGEQIEQFKKDRAWPKNPTQLSKSMGRLEPDLRACGVEITSSRKALARLFFLQKVNPASLASLDPHKPCPDDVLDSDATKKSSVILASQNHPSVTDNAPLVSTENDATKNSDATQNLASQVKPAQSETYDASDASDAKKPILSEEDTLQITFSPGDKVKYWGKTYKDAHGKSLGLEFETANLTVCEVRDGGIAIVTSPTGNRCEIYKSDLKMS